MLISSWFLSGVVILVQSALCSEVQEDGTSTLLRTDTESYRYNHPPFSEIPEAKRKEKSIDVNQPSPLNRTRVRTVRRQIKRKTTISSLQIPVEVIYETASTTVRSYTRPTTKAPVRSSTKSSVQQKRSEPNASKRIDIRQTSSKKNDTVQVKVSTDANNSNIESSTTFPKRSRETYFQKRVGPPPPRVKILREENFVYSHSGNFHYSYLGGDGTQVSSKGELKSFDNNQTGEAVSGQVSYTDKDGNDFSLSYTADENGYRPVGAHLPTPPPLPPAIARALKYIADKSTPRPEEKNN